MFRTLGIVAAVPTGSIVAASPSLCLDPDREPVIQQELEKTPEQRPTLREAEVISTVATKVDLALFETESGGKAARSKLEKGDLAKADEAGRAAEDSIDLLAGAVSEPPGKGTPKGEAKRAPANRRAS